MARARQVGGALLLSLLLLTTGCLGFLTGSEALSFSAQDATAAQSALDETGYEQTRSESVQATRNFTVAGQTRTVSLTNEVNSYTRTADLGPLGEQDAAQVTMYATPAVKIAGQTLNPVGDWSTRRVARELTRNVKGISDLTFENNRTLRVAGAKRTVSKFSGQAKVGGTSVDVYLDVAKFRHGSDFVVVVAVYPQQLAGEEGRVNTVVTSLEHAKESGD